jgi:raffinose synthase
VTDVARLPQKAFFCLSPGLFFVLFEMAGLTRYWMGPKVGKGGEDVPFDTQFLLMETIKDKQYALMLPLVDNGFRASLHYGNDDKSMSLICAAESGDKEVKNKGMRALYVAVGDDPFVLVKKGMQDVADATGTFQTLDHKILPPSVDDFGWCTWDAFYSKVSPEGIKEGVKSLRAAGAPPRNLIIDDGWQQVTPEPAHFYGDPTETFVKKVKEVKKDSSEDNVLFGALVEVVSGFYNNYVRGAPHDSWGVGVWTFLTHNTPLKGQLWQYFDQQTDFNRQLSGFNPNRKFDRPDGTGTLKSLIAELKGELDVKRVYCWHALHGYWRGVAEELNQHPGINVVNIHPKPSEHLLRLDPQLGWDPVSLFGCGLLFTEADLEAFYRKLHTPLVEAGVDGVKVDVQSGVSAVGGGVGGGPHLARLYTGAMENSVSQRFRAENGAANCINCMCHSTENLYRYQTTAVARASEDFFPGRPETHTVHLVNVAYNSLFIGEICLPDWDMFHSLHESAGLHGAARAVGGCPLYVSDAPGKHDPELLRKLVLPDGSVLRAKLPGRPTRDCLFEDVTADGLTPLKIWNENPYGGVVGAFNVQGVRWNFDTHENEVLNASPKAVTARVKPHDVESFRKVEGPFAAYRHRSSTMEFLPSGESSMQKRLDHADWEIFNIAPIQIGESNGLMWAPIGLGDMMNSGGAILSTGSLERDAKTRGTRATVESRGPGRFVAFTNKKPSKVLLEKGGSIPFTHDGDTGELSFMLPTEGSITNVNNAHVVSVYWE